MPFDHDPERYIPTEPDTRYAAALALVRTLDRDLQRGTRHYYDGQGRLLVSLDEAVRAILADQLLVQRPMTASPMIATD